MYSFKIVNRPDRCAGCGRVVTSRSAGHHYQQPMCDSCFSTTVPELAGILKPTVQMLERRSGARCSKCGLRLRGRIAGHLKGDPLCPGCFPNPSPELALLLLLSEAALEAASTADDAEALFEIAVKYAQTHYELDAEHPRNPLSKPRRAQSPGNRRTPHKKETT